MKDPLELFQHLLNRKSGLFFFLIILLNLLGAGVAHYLGSPVNWSHFVLGLVWLVVLGTGIIFLDELFHPVRVADESKVKPLTRLELQRRQNALLGMIAGILSVVAVLLVWMLHEAVLSMGAIIVVLIIVLFALLLILPPVRLWTSGVGEFILSFLFCQVIPVYAYLLQAKDLNRLLSLSTLPVTAIFFAMLIAFQFETYGKPALQSGMMLVTRIGWQNGAKAHNFLLVLAYLLIGVAFWVGLPWRIVLPFLFTLPVALLQIYLLNRITGGAKPLWRVYRYTASILTLLAIYLISYTYWTG